LPQHDCIQTFSRSALRPKKHDRRDRAERAPHQTSKLHPPPIRARIAPHTYGAWKKTNSITATTSPSCEHIKDESVDLIYLDPPFNSRQDYNVLFVEHGGRVSDAMRAFRSFLGHSDMMDYLAD